MADTRRTVVERSKEVLTQSSKNRGFADTIAAGRTQGFVFNKKAGSGVQDLERFMKWEEQKFERGGSMQTMQLFVKLAADLKAGEFPDAVNPPSGPGSVNPPDLRDRQPMYYVALQGEGMNQRLYLLLRIGNGREIPDTLWTYYLKTL